MSWSDDKKLSSGADAIGWNSLKKKKIVKIYLKELHQALNWEKSCMRRSHETYDHVPLTCGLSGKSIVLIGLKRLI